MQRLDAMGGVFEDFVLEGLMLLNVLVTTSSILSDKSCDTSGSEPEGVT